MIQPAPEPAATAPPQRPATVTVAVALQIALVGALLLTSVTAVAEAIRYDGLIDRAVRAIGASAGDAAFERSMNLSGAVAGAVSALVLAVWLGVAVVWLRRGSNVARIITLVGLGAPVVLGLVACVVGGLLGTVMVSLLASSPEDFVTDDGAFTEDGFPGGDEFALSDELARLDTGGWSIAFEVTGTATTAAALLLGIATGALLLTSQSDRYFRPRRPATAVPYPPPWPAAPPPWLVAPPPYPHHAPYWYGGPPAPYPPVPAQPPGHPPAPPPG